MTPNPFNMLIHSRKFWLAMTDAVASTALLLATRYLSPADVEMVKQIVIIYQPVILALIGSIAWEDNAERDKVASMAQDAMYAQERADIRAEKAAAAVKPS